MSDDNGSSGAEVKPSFASVTTVACTCDYLQRAAEEPFSPIVFDAEVNEFEITYLVAWWPLARVAGARNDCR